MAKYINFEDACEEIYKSELLTDNNKDWAVEAIGQAPAADVTELKHGQWFERANVKEQVYCSECATIEKATDSNYKSRRCPNCGAIMDKESES